MESIFKRVKALVTPKEAATMYGLPIDRSGFTCCLFHNDHHPSMKLYPDHYHCFSCKATGDVINMTAQLFHLSQYEAAKKMEEDFSVGVRVSVPRSEPKEKTQPLLDEEQVTWLRYAVDTLRTVRDCLEDRRRMLSPRFPDEEWHPELEEIYNAQPYVEYLLDLACSPEPEDVLMFVNEFRKEVAELEYHILRRNQERNECCARRSA